MQSMCLSDREADTHSGRACPPVERGDADNGCSDKTKAESLAPRREFNHSRDEGNQEDDKADQGLGECPELESVLVPR